MATAAGNNLLGAFFAAKTAISLFKKQFAKNRKIDAARAAGDNVSQLAADYLDTIEITCPIAELNRGKFYADSRIEALVQAVEQAQTADLCAEATETLPLAANLISDYRTNVTALFDEAVQYRAELAQFCRAAA